MPALNPYFILDGQQCTGVWSPQILEEMARVRPEVTFPGLSHTFGDVFFTNHDGRMLMTTEISQPRLKSLKLSNYRQLAIRRLTIQ